MKTTRALLPMLFTLLAGCAGAASDDGDIGETTEALTNATAAGPDYVVSVHAIGTCTGNVISQHYILSAAHCFQVSGPASISIYKGENELPLAYAKIADVILHPNWVDAADGRQDWDIALVHLRGEGMGAGAPSVHVYAGPETPWTTKGSSFTLSGYGDGSEAPDGVQSCPPATDQTFGIKRSARFTFTGDGRQDEDGIWQSVNGTSTTRAACGGDSGGGWRINRGGGEDFLVALQSLGNRVVNGAMSGTLVQPKMDWIQQSAPGLGLPLTCTVVRDQSEAQPAYYYDCVEHPRTVVVLPHPPPVFGF